jgi:porin
MLGFMRTTWIALPLVLLAGFHLASAQDSLDDVTYELGNVDSVAFESAAAECDCGETVGCGTSCDGGGWLGSTLLGNCRSHIQQSGVTISGKSTHFAFGIDGGVNTSVLPPFRPGNDFKYTGRGELDFLIDLEKFGGLPRGKLLIRAEHWYGEFGNVSLNSGSLTPPVFPTFLPVNARDPGVPVITNFLLTQPLSEKLILFAGKSDVFGSADQDIFAGGDGTDQFVNQALIANPAFLVAMPYTSFTAGVAMPREWGGIAGFVRDPQDRTKDFFRLDDLFSQGVIAGGEIKVNTSFFSKPGEHHVGGIWKHVDLPDLSSVAGPLGDYPYPPAGSGVARIKDSYTIYYGFDQYLKMYSNEPRRGWGLFGRGSISDGNPTPFEYFLSAGIGGDSPFRQSDTFGVGWYHNGTTSQFGPGLEALFGPQNGTGVELFYNFQLTRCINVTPDFQYIKPGFGAIADDSFIYGLRVNMKL